MRNSVTHGVGDKMKIGSKVNLDTWRMVGVRRRCSVLFTLSTTGKFKLTLKYFAN